MPKKQHKRIFLSLFILFCVFFVSLGLYQGVLVRQSMGEDVSSLESSLLDSSLSMKVADSTFHIPFKSGVFFYDILLEAQQNNKFQFDGLHYPILGFFVTDIGSLHQGGGKNLMYYINGKEAQVGVSSYIPKNGDIISWKLK